jgi:hypothetical protein
MPCLSRAERMAAGEDVRRYCLVDSRSVPVSVPIFGYELASRHSCPYVSSYALQFRVQIVSVSPSFIDPLPRRVLLACLESRPHRSWCSRAQARKACRSRTSSADGSALEAPSVAWARRCMARS